MSHCLNSACQKPHNPNDTKFCQNCGSKLLLRARYRALRQIGQGGFGKTFLAVDEDKPSKPHCVIKQFLPQNQGSKHAEKAAELFYQEALRLDELGKHPQIPALLAHFEQDDQQYLVQEFIDGQNLAEELAEKGVFTESQIISLLGDLLPVLQFIHDKQVIHRDIKPENIIRRSPPYQRGERGGQLVLVDFGAAKFAIGTRTGTVIGSAGYVAPEQAVGQAIFASDIYSLGVTCIHLLTQVEPWILYSVSEGDWVWRDYLPSPVSDRTSRILDRMLESATKRRYQSASVVLRDLHSQQIKQPLKPPSVLFKFLQESFSQAQTPLTSSDNLNSAVGVDYRKLESLLAAGKWEEADRETGMLMLKVASRENDGLLRVQDIKKFPCQDLQTIDQLWVKYSSTRFGLSVQKRIWQESNKNPWKFERRVGWRNFWGGMKYSNFTPNAPQGHLPTALRANFVVFFSRVEACGL